MSEELEGELIQDQSAYGDDQSRELIDVQVATAKRYPRSMRLFKERALSLATISEEVAAECFYVLPARSGGNGKPIEGPSIRLAEIIAASWGNIRVESFIIEEARDHIVAVGRAWDLETNAACCSKIRKRITTKDGRRFSADMIAVASNAACSIAYRNAVFRCVTMAVVRPIENAARSVAIGDAKTLEKRRADAILYWSKMGISKDRILARLGRPSVEDITLDDLGTLIGFYNAVRDNEASVDDCFPVEKPESTEPPQNKTDQLADRLKAAHDSTPPNEQPTEPVASNQPTVQPEADASETPQPEVVTQSEVFARFVEDCAAATTPAQLGTLLANLKTSSGLVPGESEKATALFRARSKELNKR